MATTDQKNFTDPRHLAKSAYRDGTQLRKRKTLYEFMTPHYNVEDEVIKLLALEGSEAVLDVGCGQGELLLKIALHYPKTKLTGVDISAGIFKPAWGQAQRQDLSIQFRAADAQSLPFSNASFDRVTALHMLYHVPDIERALQEMKRVLRPGRQLAVSTNSSESHPQLRHLGSQAARHMGMKERHPVSARFSLEAGEELLRKYFQNVTLTRFESTIRLLDPKPMVKYFESIRDMWDPQPTEQQWRRALDLIQQQVERAIDKQGSFSDHNVFGVLVASD